MLRVQIMYIRQNDLPRARNENQVNHRENFTLTGYEPGATEAADHIFKKPNIYLLDH